MRLFIKFNIRLKMLKCSDNMGLIDRFLRYKHRMEWNEIQSDNMETIWISSIRKIISHQTPRDKMFIQPVLPWMHVRQSAPAMGCLEWVGRGIGWRPAPLLITAASTKKDDS
jgi:hypothetical protein